MHLALPLSRDVLWPPETNWPQCATLQPNTQPNGSDPNDGDGAFSVEDFLGSCVSTLDN